MGYIGTSTHKRKTSCISALPSTAHFTCSMSKACVSTASKYSYFFPVLSMPSIPNAMLFSESAAMVCLAKYCSATGKDFCKTLETPVHLEQLKKKSPFQREEPDGREEDHSCGQHVLSMSLDDRTDWLHNHLAAADKYTIPDSKSTRRNPYHISELWIWAMPIIKAVFEQKSGKPLESKAGLTSSVGLFQGWQVWS